MMGNISKIIHKYLKDGYIWGPYYRDEKTGKWHWNPACPQFPKASEHMRLSIYDLNYEELCTECISLEKGWKPDVL